MINDFESNVTMLFVRENLKRLRESHKLSNTEVARVIGKSRQGYINYEHGARDIGIHDLVTLSNYYGVTLDEIVGNPFKLHKLAKLEYRTYEMKDGQLELSTPIEISAVNDDIVIVKRDDLHLDFFWKTQLYHKNHVMLFDFHDRPHVSKIYYNSDSSGFFLIKNEHVVFNKASSESIIIKGVFLSTLTKDFHVEHFF
jgi:transcriptional regulator with XRE-family HTH domain